MSRKIVTIITEDDLTKPDKRENKDSNQKTTGASGGGGGGGGRGGREVKTKGKDKKRKKKVLQEAENEKVNKQGQLTEDEINEILQNNEMFDFLNDDERQCLGMS